ncbi:RagB/SusD family nutrient uptake outer membrane protein [Chryseobacterium aahli]|uniref:RagB/SusD family nutrient uptake outer membrane protein n=1 Tax=Chryseobacterium aahli TaxID=1278643 RepID=UPI001F60A850|nr:RagB/SusD family nutrient uptake outer membrane protein [Chryseobacterium aahli]MCI3937981.1 RagB/SusD family nutrient uptake outer membrane protein [Chryseobacterium aahli]
MKKYIKLVLLSAGTLFVSCDNDLLEPYTPGQNTEEVALKTSTDLGNLMNSAYANISSRSEAVDVSVFTDEVSIGFGNGGQGISDDYVFLMNPGSSLPQNIWANSYAALARINRVIKYADIIVPSNAADAQVIARIKAQALTMRAYCHLRLLAYFTTDMKDNNALAAIISDRVFATTESQNLRATNGAFYSLIHSDLNAAISLYTANPTAFSNVIANEVFAKGLKARAYAYKGDYTNALIYANDVISSGLVLATPAQYRQVFFSDNQPVNAEVIFKLRRTPVQNAQASNLHNGWVSLQPNLAGSPFYEMSRSLHNVLNPANLPATHPTDPNVTTLPDVRANVNIAPSSVIDAGYLTSTDIRNTDKIVINKHGGTASGTTTWATTAANTNNNDFKIMRLSEMYLIRAEAYADAANLNLSMAAANIKSIRDARFGAAQTAPVYSSAAQAWAGILNERRIEFSYEGYRFIDLKRLGTLAGQGIDRHPADYNASSANYPGANPANLPLNSFKWALPIPQIEINVNKVIQQNPGY